MKNKEKKCFCFFDVCVLCAGNLLEDKLFG